MFSKLILDETIIKLIIQIMLRRLNHSSTKKFLPQSRFYAATIAKINKEHKNEIYQPGQFFINKNSPYRGIIIKRCENISDNALPNETKAFDTFVPASAATSNFEHTAPYYHVLIDKRDWSESRELPTDIRIPVDLGNENGKNSSGPNNKNSPFKKQYGAVNDSTNENESTFLPKKFQNLNTDQYHLLSNEEREEYEDLIFKRMRETMGRINGDDLEALKNKQDPVNKQQEFYNLRKQMDEFTPVTDPFENENDIYKEGHDIISHEDIMPVNPEIVNLRKDSRSRHSSESNVDFKLSDCFMHHDVTKG